MSFDYPAGVHTGYTGFANYLAQRLGAVVGSPTSIPAPTGTDGYLRSLADAILGGVKGPQGPVVDVEGGGQVAPTGGVFTGLVSGNFTAYVGREYMVEVDIAALLLTTAAGTAFFRLSLDGNPLTPPLSWRFRRNYNTDRGYSSMRHKIYAHPGGHTLVVEWHATAQFVFDSTAALTVHVT